MKKHLTMLVALAALACPVKGNTVIDTFNGIPGNTANGAQVTAGNSEGIGFTGGYTQSSSVVTFWTNDVVVTLTNYVSGQTNTASHWSVGGSIGTALRRAQIRPTVPLSGTIWFSYLAALNNTNGDTAIILNPTGFDGSGSPTPSVSGVRIGIGFAGNQGQGRPYNLTGMLGVGPLFIGSGNPFNANQSINLITNGVNGALSATQVAPTDGTGGLVLGCIYTTNGYQRIDIWYDPDVTNQASLPAPTVTFTDTNNILLTNTYTITAIGYSVTRDTVHDEFIDNVKLSDETNGFDLVYLNAQLPVTSVNVFATQAVGTSVGPTYSVQTNIIFNIVSDRVAVSPINVTYNLSGSAVSGTDYGVSASSLTIPVGSTNVTLAISPTNTGVPNGDLTVILSVQTGTGYVAGNSSSAVGTILAQNNAGVPVQYMFGGTLNPNVFNTSLTASPASVAGIGGDGNYSSAYYVSPTTSFLVGGQYTTNDEADAVAMGNYMGIVVSPVVGAGMTLTNLQFDAVYGNYLNAQPGATSAGVVIRSSLDNFASDLTNFTLFSDEITFPQVWTNLNIPLGNSFSNLSGSVEFRIYFYDDSQTYNCGVRVDNLYLQGTTFSEPLSTERVSVVASIPNASVGTGTSGEFNITRTGDTTSALTVYYNMEGSASNGLDYASLPGSAIIPAGQTNILITVTPLDAGIPEPAKTVVLRIANSSNYGILQPDSATVNLAANGDLPGLVVYYFNENNNAAPSLASVAVATVTPSLSTKIIAGNAAAGPGLGTFGPGGTSGNGNGYGSSAYYSPPSTLYIWGGVLTNDEVDAVNCGTYCSFTIGPAAGFTLTLTNFLSYIGISSAAGDIYYTVLRSSRDNYSSDIGVGTFTGSSVVSFQQWSVPLGITNSVDATTFRMYVYGDLSNTAATNDYVRIDDATFQGSVGATPKFSTVAISSGNITMTFSGNSYDQASQFTLQSATNVCGPYINDNSAVVSGSGGAFQIIAPINGPTRFYKIRYQ